MEKITKESKTDESAYHLHSSDHPGMPLVNTILDGKNYWAWSISVMTALEAKNKTGFVDGTIEPPQDPAEYKKWKMADSMIKSWMVNCISKEIADLFVFCTSSKSLWDILAERYGVSNAPQMYHLHRYANSVTQGNESVTTYFNKINRCWDEIGRLSPLPICTCSKCSCNVSKKIADLDNSLKLMQFLLGLTPSYDVIRTQILNLTPLPSINKAYAMVVSDESQRQINLTYSANSEGSSAMMAKVFQGKNDGTNFKKRDLSKKDKYCDHCKVNGHTRETCFKIHGYPEWFKEMREKRGTGQKKQTANLVNETSGDTPIVHGDNEQNLKGDLTNMVAYLMKEVQKLNKGKTRKDEQVNFIHDFAGNISLNPKQLDDLWIIDTGATSHMCSNKSLIRDLKPLMQPRLVHLPDKSKKIIHNIGTVIINSELVLKNVLFVPSFKYNLLSVNKLAKDSNISFSFDSYSCVLQDQTSKKILAKGISMRNLYYLTTQSEPTLAKDNPHNIFDRTRHRHDFVHETNKVGMHDIAVKCSDDSVLNKVDMHDMIAKCNVNPVLNKNSIDLWHFRLGHASGNVLNHINQISLTDSTQSLCTTCHNAKQTRIPFKTSDSRSENRMELLHIDLWGPYKCPALNSAHYFLTIVDDCTRATWTLLLQNKTQVCKTPESFLELSQKQYNAIVKIIRTDNGTETIAHPTLRVPIEDDDTCSTDNIERFDGSPDNTTVQEIDLLDVPPMVAQQDTFPQQQNQKQELAPNKERHLLG
ncbi:uncharacterized protein G2W53_004661 [Senna tora]|uniref:GAG-pre-integrase domain-containing protein n=1 Tax=Senna tora TaxID=362788 RepID=A0A834XBK3_9FABA|nr:uncharacterized protein G2W53_004661 [Senna tora]